MTAALLRKIVSSKTADHLSVPVELKVAGTTLILPPTTYLRQVYLDTVVFSYHQLAYLLDLFGPDRILMGTDYPFDMAEYNPVGHVAGVQGMDEATLAQIAGGNAARVLGLDV